MDDPMILAANRCPALSGSKYSISMHDYEIKITPYFQVIRKYII